LAACHIAHHVVKRMQSTEVKGGTDMGMGADGTPGLTDPTIMLCEDTHSID